VAAASSTPDGELRGLVDRSHRSLAWLLAGAGLGLTGALVTLTLGASPAAWALCGAASLAAGLRARRLRFTAQVAALAVPALAGLLALEAALPLALGGPAGAAAAAALLLATAAAALGLALGARELAEPSPRRRRLLDAVELCVNLALIPLAVAALGVFGLVYQEAHRLG
jgi:ESX secretion system protein EccD